MVALSSLSKLLKFTDSWALNLDNAGLSIAGDPSSFMTSQVWGGISKMSGVNFSIVEDPLTPVIVDKRGDPIPNDNIEMVMQINYPKGTYRSPGNKLVNNGTIVGGSEFYARPFGNQGTVRALLEYDLYFPPKKVDKLRIKQRGNTLIPSLFFFPGFGIDHAAYSDVAARISDSGIAVAVISLEPLRLAHKALGGGIDDLRRLLRVADGQCRILIGSAGETGVHKGMARYRLHRAQDRLVLDPLRPKPCHHAVSKPITREPLTRPLRLPSVLCRRDRLRRRRGRRLGPSSPFRLEV